MLCTVLTVTSYHAGQALSIPQSAQFSPWVKLSRQNVCMSLFACSRSVPPQAQSQQERAKSLDIRGSASFLDASRSSNIP